jgi:hypothetical protein
MLDQITSEITSILNFAGTPPQVQDMAGQLEYLRSLTVYVARLAQLQAEAVALYAEAKSAAVRGLDGIARELSANERKAVVDGLIAKFDKAVTLAERAASALDHAGGWMQSILSTNRAEMRFTPQQTIDRRY